MKNVAFFAISLITISLFSCNKENKYPKGNATAEYNDYSWNAEQVFATPSRFDNNNLIEIYIVKNPSDAISYHTGFGNVQKSFTLQKLYPAIINQNSDKKVWTDFVISQDYDVNGDEYDLLESDSANNWLQITSAEDNFTKNIEGTFNATYYRTKTYQGSPNPDTIRLRNGTFYISKLKE